MRGSEETKGGFIYSSVPPEKWASMEFGRALATWLAECHLMAKTSNVDSTSDAESLRPFRTPSNGVSGNCKLLNALTPPVWVSCVQQDLSRDG